MTTDCAIPCRKKDKKISKQFSSLSTTFLCMSFLIYFLLHRTCIQKEIPGSSTEILDVILTVFPISDVRFTDAVISLFKHWFSGCDSYWVGCKYLAIFFQLHCQNFQKSKAENTVVFSPPPANKKNQTFLFGNELFFPELPFGRNFVKEQHSLTSKQPS